MVLRMLPKPRPWLRRAEGIIESSDGTSYECSCTRGLAFTVRQNDVLIVEGLRFGPGQGDVTIVQGATELGKLVPGALTPLGDRLVLGDRCYKLPTIFRPAIPELGLRFSRWGLFGLWRLEVKIDDQAATVVAIAVLAYLFARRRFVEG